MLERPLVARAVEPEQPQPLCDLLARGDRHAAVAHRRKVLRGEEREGRHIAIAADAMPLVGRAERLRRVLHERDAMAVGQLPERAEVGRLAEQVDRHDSPRPLGDRGLGRGGVEAERDRIDVGEDGRGAAARDRLGGREEGVRRGHDLVPGADAERLQPELDGVGAVGDGHGMAVADRGGHLLLERPHVRAEDEAPGVDHLADQPLDLGQQLLVLPADVHQGYSHERRTLGRVRPPSSQ